MEFGGPEVYKEREGIKQEESYLPRIFRPFCINWHTFIMLILHSDVKFSFVNMASCPWKIGNIIIFWLLTSWFWPHNAGEILLELLPPFFLKSSGTPNCTLTKTDIHFFSARSWIPKRNMFNSLALLMLYDLAKNCCCLMATSHHPNQSQLISN